MIIRNFRPDDSERLTEIWYNVSITAHSFIPSEMWDAHKEELRNKYLPSSETWVAEENSELLGFISVLGNYIGGLFIAENRQGMGIGTKLIEQVKLLKRQLYVGVYSKNEGARKFYGKNGFSYLNEEVQTETGEIIINMTYEKE